MAFTFQDYVLMFCIVIVSLILRVIYLILVTILDQGKAFESSEKRKIPVKLMVIAGSGKPQLRL